MLVKITKRAVDSMQPGEHLADSEIKGFVARCLPSGTVSYGYRYRNSTGHRRLFPLGLHGQITADKARALAKQRAGEVASDRDPTEERAAKRAKTTNTVNAVLDNFLARYVRAQGLRSADEIERTFRVYVRPQLGDRSIYELKRSDIVALLDHVEDNNGPVMADRVLAYVRKAFNWQATRDDNFAPPMVRGMARTKPKDRARTRVLADDEIRDLWTALDRLGGDVPNCFPAFVRSLLLTAQRLRMVSLASWNEIMGRDWTIPVLRNKTKVDHLVPLSESVVSLFGPKRKGFVFSSDGGKRAFSGFSKSKRMLDRKIAEIRKQEKRPSMPPWVLHDLRRTARSLMSRAGVDSNVAERVLGHVIPGVRGVYDRHAYEKEKRDALGRLAMLIDHVLHQSDKVVPLTKGAPKR